MERATVEFLTIEEIIALLAPAVQRKLGMTVETFARLVREDPDQFAGCEYAELIGLLDLLPQDDPIFGFAA